MRELALGRLLLSPVRFGNMLAGDFLDALTGYFKGEKESLKNTAELLRIHASLLWNVQVGKADKLTPMDLWPFVWDKSEETPKGELVSNEELQRRQELQDKFLF